MVNATQLKAGIGDYIQQRMMPRLDGKRQFLLGTLYGMCAGRMDAIFAQAAQNPTVRALGVVRDDGLIDIDAVYSAAHAQMQAQQKLRFVIPLMGEFTFDESDLRDLRECIAGRENT